MTFTLGIVADLRQDARFFRWKNTLSVCVTPLEVLISFLYWGLRTVSWGSGVYYCSPPVEICWGGGGKEEDKGERDMGWGEGELMDNV